MEQINEYEIDNLGGTTNEKPQLVDLQFVEVLFLHGTPFGVLYRVLKFKRFISK